MIKAVSLQKAKIAVAVLILCNIFGMRQYVCGLQNYCLNSNGLGGLQALTKSFSNAQKQFFHRTYPQLPMYTDNLNKRYRDAWGEFGFREILPRSIRQRTIHGFWCLQMGSVLQKSMTPFGFNNSLQRRILYENMLELAKKPSGNINVKI